MRRVDGLLLDSGEILLADYLVRHGVDYLQRRNGGSIDPRAVALRDRLAAFAGRETVAVVVNGRRESSEPAAAVIVTESLPAEMTVQVQAVAGWLRISPQAVRGLCRTGKLLATRGPAGHWRIDTHSAAALAARREGQA